MPDISFEQQGNEFLIHAESPRGGRWIARFITTNVATLRYTDKTIWALRLA